MPSSGADPALAFRQPWTTSSQKTPHTMLILVAVILICFIKGVPIRPVGQHELIASVIADLRYRLHEKIQEQSLAFFTRIRRAF